MDGVADKWESVDEKSLPPRLPLDDEGESSTLGSGRGAKESIMYGPRSIEFIFWEEEDEGVGEAGEELDGPLLCMIEILGIVE